MSLFFPTDFGNYIKTQLDPDPSNGYIVGVDKPRLLIEDNKIYSLIVDKTVEPFLTDLPNLELFFFKKKESTTKKTKVNPSNFRPGALNLLISIWLGIEMTHFSHKKCLSLRIKFSSLEIFDLS
jgi:hypothetical protein